MTEQQPQRIDLRPFQLFIPAPSMLADAFGYSGQMFGHPLDAHYVGFYWERSGDEAMADDGRASGTGEYTGFLAFVDHPKVAAHLRYCDFGSSETLPRHMLILDRTEHLLYALPVRLAQQFLHQQWAGQDPSSGEQLGRPVVENLEEILNLASWQEVKLPGDISAQVAANMQRQGRLVNELVEWLNEQHATLLPERIAEFAPHATALLLRHVMGGKVGFARAGEVVHIHAVHEVPLGAMISFLRDNGIDGPDTSQVFTVSGSWALIAETLEVLLDLGSLDDLLENEAPLQQVFGRYADWNGQAFPIVPMLESLAIRVSLPCARCGRNPMTLFMRSGLHRGAFCYGYDARGKYQVNLRDQEYTCARCSSGREPEEDA